MIKHRKKLKKPVIYIEDNIPKAKAEATNKQYDNAINILETILKFDSNNKETINLKDTYNLEIQKIRDEEEEKNTLKKKLIFHVQILQIVLQFLQIIQGIL